MTARSIAAVDLAIDRYIKARTRRQARTPEGFRTQTLAKFIGISREVMSGYLQEYRIRQGTPAGTRYVIACKDYGRVARWHILARPGADPFAVRAARLEAAKWSVLDVMRHATSDILRELQPPLQGTASDQVIEQVTIFVKSSMENMANLAIAVLDQTTP